MSSSSFSSYNSFFPRLTITTLTLVIASVLVFTSKSSALTQIGASNTNTPSLSNGLVFYLPFDGKDISGTTAFDRSGQGNNGTLTNGPTKTIGKIGQALTFNGSNAYVAANSFAGASSPIASGDVTFSAWVNLSASHDASASSWKIIMETSDASSTNDILLFFNTIGALGADGALCLYVNSSPGYSACTTQVSWSSGIWQHVAGTYSGVNGAKVYVNGVQVGSNGTTGRGSTKATKFTIGAHYPGGSAGYFPGTIDEVRVYNRALSASEVSKLYLSGQAKINTPTPSPVTLSTGLVGHWKFDKGSGTSAVDSSANGNTGTLGNGPTWGMGKIGGGVVFDGSNDYVAANSFAGAASPIASGDVTFSAWIKLSASHTSGSSADKNIMTLQDTPSTNDIWLYYAYNGGDEGTPGALCLNVYHNGRNFSCTTQTSWSAGTWQHVVGTYSGVTGSKLYLDGKLVASNSHVGRGTTYATAFTIGSKNPGGAYPEPFAGVIDEARVYNRALSPSEVSKLYRVGLGSTITAVPTFTCGVSTVLDADSNVYNTLQIGSQCWMQQNLRVGTRISGGTNQSDNDTIEKYCYSNTDSNCTSNNPNHPDGGLYQWDEAMQYSTTPGAQGICPAGWHIPTHDEFTTLERAVCTSGSCSTDFPYDTTTTGTRGTNEGTKLRPNGTSGFEANLAGYGNGGAFSTRTLVSYFWTSTRSGASWYRLLNSVATGVARSSIGGSYSFSIRCLKN